MLDYLKGGWEFQTLAQYYLLISTLINLMVELLSGRSLSISLLLCGLSLGSRVYSGFPRIGPVRGLAAHRECASDRLGGHTC